MITFSPFWDLCKEQGVSTYRLIKSGISSATIDRLRHDAPISTETIDRLCSLLECRPENIIEYRE